MKNRLLFRYFFWTLTIAVMTFIFFMSHQSRAVSSQTSESFIKFFLSVFTFIDETKMASLVDGLQFIVRKGAHFTIYAVLGVSSYSAMLTYSIKPKIQILISCGFCLLYAISDEIHQLFVLRGGKLYDVGIDFLGSVVGILIVYIIFKFVDKRRRKNA